MPTAIWKGAISFGLVSSLNYAVTVARPLTLSVDQWERLDGSSGARLLLTEPENTVTSIAKLLGVSRNTVYKYVPELKGGSFALAGAGDPAIPQPR